MEATKLAQLLFSQLVLADEKRVLEKEYARYKGIPEFNQSIFSRQVFVYLVASIAVALANAYFKYPQANNVQFEFRRLVRNEMKSRWGYSEEKTDDTIQEAITDYTKLVFAEPDREKHRGITIGWAQNWIKKVGIEEFNIMVLLRISSTWINQFICLANFLQEVLQ